MALTYFYADVFGVLLLILSLALLANRHTMLEVIREVLALRAVMFILAVLTLFIGLVVVLTHNIWNAGPLAAVVSAIGWLFIIRSVLLLFLPHITLQKIARVMTFEQIYYAGGILAFVVGLYLTYNGFFL
jgi:vacuolar-type H+-ATPase subunit I/STV1